MLRAAQVQISFAHNHSSELLIHHSGFSYICSCLETEMEFEEVLQDSSVSTEYRVWSCTSKVFKPTRIKYGVELAVL